MTGMPLGQRLEKVLVPTPGQAVGALALALGGLGVAYSRQLLSAVGIPERAVIAVQEQAGDKFGFILDSPITSNLALIIFWASVGLAAYLVWWGINSVFVEARNEVTITTTYTNRGRWSGPGLALLVKVACGLGLVLYLALFRSLVSLWGPLFLGALTDPQAGTVAQAVIAVTGLAVQLYLGLVLIQLTFSSWIEDQTFTG